MTDVDNDNNEKEPEEMIPFFSIASRDFEQDLCVLKDFSTGDATWLSFS